ncbi:MAG: MBL fold metallo-hydrolase [Chloroflexota bacterium]|nr:MBL fold metallo-hydrolase [Chloroflexota bacterium]
MSELNLQEVDKLEVTVLIDNYTDALLLQGTDIVKRPMTPPPNLPLAEHGFSCLLKVYRGAEEHVALLDAGVSSACFFHNARVLNVDLSKIEAVVLSHGHLDHFGALVDFLNKAAKGIPVVLHPDAFLQRCLNNPITGQRVELPRLDEAALKETGAVIHKIKEASTLFSDLVLISGEVRRVTDFEKGFPWAEAKIDDEWVVDPFHDDQGVAVKVKGKGLVVIGGCSHAGIINTVKHLQAAAETSKVHAVLGGFHLTGPIFEPIIGPTIEEMKKISPDFVMPMHCTGWQAINQFAREMPQQFVLTTVGTTYVFQ